MKTYAFIFARGGSKGVPGKNIKDICGKPLIAYSIEIAQAINRIDKIFVSTEDDKIATISKRYGASIIPRPSKLAQDDSSEWLAWQHAIRWLEERDDKFDIFLSLPTTSPLRNTKDVTSCLSCLNEKSDAVITMTKSSRSPWFNMVQQDSDGYVKVLMENNQSFIRRQEVPKAYDMTTVAYVTRPEYIINSKSIFDGKVKAVIVPPERAVDIDTELDFLLAELLLKNEYIQNQLLNN